MIRPTLLSVIVGSTFLLLVAGSSAPFSRGNQRAAASAAQRVDFYVTAQQGELFVTDLSASEFAIREDDKPQEIQSLHAPGEIPISLLFLIDRGRDSTTDDLERAQALLRSFTAALKTRSEIAMAAYSSELRFIRPFSSDLPTLANHIAQIPSFTGKSSTGNAIDYAIRSVQSEARHPRRVLIVLSSEFHQFGPGTLDHVLTDFLQLHFVNVGHEGLGRGFVFSELTAKNLNSSASKTGGRFWQANSEENAPIAGQRLARFLDAQYAIGYTSTNGSRKGKTRSITVRTPERQLELTYMRQYFEPRF